MSTGLSKISGRKMKKADKRSPTLMYLDNGFSFLEVMMSLGILSIVTWAMTSMIISLMNENKSLSEKLESIELEQSVVRLTTDSSVCSCMFDSPAWTTGVTESLLAVCEHLNGSSKLKTESLKLKNISDIGSGNLMGDLEIKLSGGGRPIKPLLISGLSFSPDNVSLPKKLTNCLGVAGAQQLCTGLGGTWNGRCSLPPTAGSEPLGISETCVALGGTFTAPQGLCVFNNGNSSSSDNQQGKLVGHCDGQIGISTRITAQCKERQSCTGGATLPKNCPAGSRLGNYKSTANYLCDNVNIVSFDCISN